MPLGMIGTFFLFPYVLKIFLRGEVTHYQCRELFARQLNEIRR